MVKIVDKRVRSEPGEYGISFAARDEQGSYEHAFVIWYYSDPAGNRTNRRGAGFYPTGDPSVYDLLVGGTVGKVFDDSEEKIGKQVIVLVNSDIFKAALKVESKYSNDTYRLLTNDCVSFVATVAETVPGLKVPSRVTNLSPSTFVAALHDAN